jgi:hypothetical protein
MDAPATGQRRPSELLATLKRLGFGMAIAVPDSYPHRPIGPQVEAAATYAEEASSPFALLPSREDIQW